MLPEGGFYVLIPNTNHYREKITAFAAKAEEQNLPVTWHESVFGYGL